MIGSTLGSYSNYLAVPGEDPSPTSASFNSDALRERLVIGFLGDIFLCKYNIVRHYVAD
jgi:hypothetical protein